MVPTTLVDAKIDDGEKLIKRLVATGTPVRAAYWLYDAERGPAKLHIVSPIVDQEGSTAMYRRIRSALSSLEFTKLSVDEMAARGTKDPLLPFLDRNVHVAANPDGTRVTNTWYRDTVIDDMYIYRLD